MKLVSTEQIRELDQFTILNEPIASIDLMERAARACVNRIVKLLTHDEKITIACGKGNNGGDGLAIARQLNELGYESTVLLIQYSPQFSKDAQTNFLRLKEKFPEKIIEISGLDELLAYKGEGSVLVDALVGTGLNKAVDGLLADVMDHLNKTFQRIISIDIPSGLFGDKSSVDNRHIMRSSLTLSFQFPKLAFLFAQNKQYVPEFELLNIGIHPAGIEKIDSTYFYLSKEDISGLLKKRSKFSHKGSYGHALLMAGSKGKSGAAVISAQACLRSGAGLLTLHSTKDTIQALLHRLPEAMSQEDVHPDHLSEIEHPEKYNAIAFGMGCGTHADTQLVLKKLLNYYDGNLLIDADGLNILSENKTWLSFLKAGTILTPHPKEFERLTEKHSDDFEQLKAAKHFSLKYRCILILKGAHTLIAMPDGNVFFNSSGNAGLAKGGSGDALSGILLGLLARGYTAPQAAIIGTYIHGFAADLCTQKKSEESVLISDVIDMLPKAFKKLEMIKA